MGETKVCSKCRIEKPKTEFHKRNVRPIGVTSWCKQCCAEKDKKRDRSEYWQSEQHKTNTKKASRFCRELAIKQYVFCKYQQMILGLLNQHSFFLA